MTKVEDNKHNRITGLGDIIYEPEGGKAEVESVITWRGNF
jgi:ribosomal protein S27E